MYQLLFYAMYVLLFALVASGPLVAIVLSIIAMRRSRRARDLEGRVAALEAALRGAGMGPVAGDHAPAAAPSPGLMESAAPSPVEPATSPAVGVVEPSEPFNWERFIGQKTLGWVAVVLLVFAAAFFLRYAYQNNWIGPAGRVTIGALMGAALVVIGQRYHVRGWRNLAQMVSGAGIVVLYLVTYSAFGFYHLLPPYHAGYLLALMVVESMLLAAVYNSPAIGFVAVLGGLVTPLLLQTDHDSYQALFLYLAVLDIGVVLLMLLRRWPLVGTLALVGTHVVFWMWYGENYHPEKFGWALGFQLAVYAIFLIQVFIALLARCERESREDLGRLILHAVLWFAAFYVLTVDDYRMWLGSAAVAMATLYALLARVALAWRPASTRLLLTSLAVASGFVAWAMPIQAEAYWVALGWAVMGTALWWFGLRISAVPLRLLGAALGSMAVVRLVSVDMQHGYRELFIPIFNEFGLPSVGVAACLLLAASLARRYRPAQHRAERFLVAVAGLAGILLLWLVLSIECTDLFYAYGREPGADRAHWRWLSQLALSILWASYAAVVLTCGFLLRRASLRWTAIGLFAVTIAKVFFIDMSTLQQFYRILAFFILAVVLGLVARFYQRLSVTGPRAGHEGT